MLERRAWLAGDVLLMAGSGSQAQQQEIESSTTALGNQALDVVTRAVALSNGNEADSRLLAVSQFREAPARPATGLSMTFGSEPTTLSLDSTPLVDSTALLREELSRLGPAHRAQALRFLWTAIGPVLDRRGSFPLAQLLAALNQEFRPALPPLFRGRDDAYAAHVDVLLKLDERALWVQGWIHDRENATSRLTLVAPEGGRAELQPGLFRHRRQDIQEMFHDKVGVQGERHGFIRYVELDGPSHVAQGWLLELETLFGDVGERAVPPAECDLITSRERILPNLPFEHPGSEELMRQHMHPALARIQEHLRDAPEIEGILQIGDPPSDPTVSVIVPLYAQLWFMEYQMAHWASDPELPQQDLIYVLDTPEQATVLEELAHGLHSIYGIPFRLAVMKGNAGFAGVNNQAVQHARADKLLLLNSDVVPDTPGWLGRMAAFYDATPNIGALGPKLIYEDDSLQHAGLYFEQLPETPPVWHIMHYFKGQHRSLPAANLARQVPAVTGACMMVSRDLYERMDGLSYRYLQGGYEDTDFCMRLTDEGVEHWYIPGAELYHLENRSYPPDLRQQTTFYNRWLHNELCGDRIAATMAQFSGRDS